MKTIETAVVMTTWDAGLLVRLDHEQKKFVEVNVEEFSDSFFSCIHLHWNSHRNDLELNYLIKNLC